MVENSLNWESTYAIALRLKHLYPQENLEQVSLNQIFEWTTTLPEFEDDPSLANDDILLSIYQDWLEEILNDQS